MRKLFWGSTTSEICLKNPVGCLQQPRAAVIGLSLPSGLEATLPGSLRANGFSDRLRFPLRPKIISVFLNKINFGINLSLFNINNIYIINMIKTIY